MKIRDYLRRRLGLSVSLIACVKYDNVKLNGEYVHMRALVKDGDVIEITLPDEESENIEPMNVPIDVIYEDDYIIDTDRYSLDVYRYSTDEEGLYVFIWQLAANSYSCCVKEKTKEGYTYSDLWNMKSIGLEGARMAVAGSGYAKEAVTIVPFSMPYSSYLNIEASKDPAAYRQKLENLFWGEE